LLHNAIVIVYLALGSNLGDRRSYLEAGIAGLERRDVQVLRSASVYSTEPRDLIGPWFLNTVVEANTILAPEQLLEACLAVERENSRKRTGVKASRTLDVDIILYGGLTVSGPGLSIPHPAFRNRRFVLEPLAEIVPDFVDPATGKTIRELLDAVTDAGQVAWAGLPLR
jgi:2-amino-4-hydroxy-6-hydroxymethyldihydropteridine diphosphokinase